MAFYFVGVEMRSRTHDYEAFTVALNEIRAERISNRIWLFDVDQTCEELTFALQECLAPTDKLLVDPVMKGESVWAQAPSS